MGKINVLDFAVANLIAAGEVVDNPASAIKEMSKKARKGANVARSYYNEYFRNTCFNGDCYKYGHGIMLMRWRTYPEEFLRIRVPNPPLEEQQEIADYLAEKCGEIDALIAKKEAFVEEMEAYKQSLIYEYVTGKKEVL